MPRITGTTSRRCRLKYLKNNEVAGGRFKRRDAVVSIAAGTLIAVAVNVWYNLVVRAGTIGANIWLDRIHRPAAFLAERLAFALYPKIGDPWTVRFAVAFGYGVLLAMWILAVIAVTAIVRRIAKSEVRFRNLLLLSLVICGVGYLGLALMDIPAYTLPGMTWNVALVASWIVTTAVAWRLCGRTALWLLLEAPLVLLPFYAPFLINL